MWELQVCGYILHIATALISLGETFRFQLDSMASTSHIQRNDYSDRSEETLGKKANPVKANYGVKSHKSTEIFKNWKEAALFGKVPHKL